MNQHQLQRTAFVLAGGGSLGAVQVGMLKALVRQRIAPDFVVGASVGAINGAYFAAAPDEAGMARLERIWLGLRSRTIFPFSLTGTVLCLLGKRDHLVRPDPLLALIEAELPYQRLEQATLPCHVIATDVLDGTQVTLSSGAATEALLASAAIPAVFPSVTIAGRPLMDGGIASNTPIAAAISLGATRVIVLPTGMPCALQAPPAGALATMLHALNLLAMRQLLADVERFEERCELVVVPPLCPVSTHIYDFSQTAKLIQRAEAATRRWLERGLQNRDPRWALLPHRHRRD